jgi:isocitrate lyase
MTTTTSTPTPKRTPRPFIFDYKSIQQNSISVNQLDAIASIVINSGTGTVASIIAGVKLILILGWLVARSRMINEQMLVAQQLYEQQTTADNEDAVNDPLIKR